jgi:hypothetical protein
LLSVAYADRSADQWLYLPELGRVRYLGARIRSDAFMGTDLSYRDLEIMEGMPFWTRERATVSLLGEGPMGGTLTDVLVVRPTAGDIGYRAIVVWLGRDDGVPRQLEFYDADLVRRFWQGDVSLVDGIPVAHHGEAESMATATHTVLDVSEVRFDEGLAIDLFSLAGLERGFGNRR